MARWVLDANVAVKWFAWEDLWQKADLFRSTEHELVAPDIILWEALNTLLTKARLREVPPATATEALPIMYEQFQIVSGELLLDSAIELAMSLNITLFDATYLRLALNEDCQLVTADSGLANAAQGSYPNLVRRLHDIVDI